MRHAYDDELPFEDTLRSLRRIGDLAGVEESFRDAVRAVALRMVSRQDRYRCLYEVSQLAELGTGIGGGRQSDRQDDVVLNFITGAGGSAITIRMTAHEAILRDRDRPGTDPVRVPYSDLGGILAAVDAVTEAFWMGEDPQAALARLERTVLAPTP